jgi:hypothetical protein
MARADIFPTKCRLNFLNKQDGVYSRYRCVMTLYRMTPADMYREKAADMAARAQTETSSIGREEYERLALGYMRLAEHADRGRCAAPR